MAVLQTAGLSARAVQRAAARGTIRRVRSGWYALDDLDPLLLQAAGAGGAVGCVSGCRLWGIWAPHHEALHLIVPRNARRIRAAAGTIVHWTGTPGSSHPLSPLAECVRVAVRCADAADAFAVVESVLRSRRDSSWLARAVLESPLDRRELLRRAGSASESGTESIVAFHLLRIGVPFIQQASIAGVGRVDFVIGDRLILEADSDEHHGKPEQRRRDRRRDTSAAALGLTTLRFDYTQVVFDWSTCELAIRAALAHGDHVGRRLQMS
jgi:very-short-patch-repair endonuclease